MMHFKLNPISSNDFHFALIIINEATNDDVELLQLPLATTTVSLRVTEHFYGAFSESLSRDLSALPSVI